MSILKKMATGKESAANLLSSISSPQNVCLILGAFFGLLFVFITPPALVGDEPNHFFRAYQLSEGNIIGEKRGDLSGGWIPQSVLVTNRKLVGDIEMKHEVKFDTKLLSELLPLPLNNQDKVFERFPNTVVYTPVPYIPQVLGILAGRIFNASPLQLIYSARIFNLFFFLGLAYFAIKKTPVHKWVFCLLSLTPTNVFQVASASADAFTYGICFLTISYFLHLKFDPEEKIQGSELGFIFLLSILSVMCKQAYIFLPLLFLIIPARKLGSLKKYLITLFALLAACCGSVGVWSAAIKPIFLPYRIDQPISPPEQARFILENPFNFIGMIFWNYYQESWFYFKSFSGQLTWFDLYVPDYLPVCLFMGLVAFGILDKTPDYRVDAASKLIFIIILCCTTILISTLLYMTWSPIRGSQIEGIQGRYFIPVAPLFFLLFYNCKLYWRQFEKYSYIFVYLTVITSLLITLRTVIYRYYI